MYKWKILIVTSDKIIPEYFTIDKMFNNSNWSFFNVSKNILQHDRFDIINSCNIDGYEYLGKDWAESEVIYNIYKLHLFDEYDYLGIIHWDFELHDNINNTNRITENIQMLLDKHNFLWISLFDVNEQYINGIYDVLMDERKPNCLFVRDSGLTNPKSCNQVILNILKQNNILIHNKQSVGLCCSFVTTKDIFYNIGSIISQIKDSNILDKYDTEHRHRFPGQVMERLVALYSMYPEKYYGLRLTHKFIGGQELKMKDLNGENY